MAFQSIGAARYPKYNEIAPNTVLVEGWYVKSEIGKFGTPTHYFEEPSGQMVGLSNSGHLAYFIKQLSVGDYVRVTYLGKEMGVQTKYGTKDIQKFTMDKDPDRSRGVTAAVRTELVPPTEDDVEAAF